MNKTFAVMMDWKLGIQNFLDIISPDISRINKKLIYFVELSSEICLLSFSI